MRMQFTMVHKVHFESIVLWLHHSKAWEASPLTPPKPFSHQPRSPPKSHDAKSQDTRSLKKIEEREPETPRPPAQSFSRQRYATPPIFIPSTPARPIIAGASSRPVASHSEPSPGPAPG